MTLEPLLTANLPVQVHVIFAAFAMLSGPVAMGRRSRDRMHKIFGYVWVASMAGTAISSFLIPSAFSPMFFGPIHLLSIYALWSLLVAMRAVFKGDIRTHRNAMEGLLIRGLILAGSLTFLPGRTLSRAFFNDSPWLGVLVFAAVLVWVFRPARFTRRWRTMS